MKSVDNTNDKIMNQVPYSGIQQFWSLKKQNTNKN